WFRMAFDYVNVSLGPNYLSLVAGWIANERLHGWKKGGRRDGLLNSDRPREVTSWIMSGRYRVKKARVTSANVEEFAGQVWDWWTALQPEWRGLSPRGRPARLGLLNATDTWGSLDTHGNNGWLSLVVCAKWWRLALMEHTGDEASKDLLEKDW
ncbi:hypothetical protein K435DRAFT_598660, partial [Dendrothele bispora CBS 962.96]